PPARGDGVGERPRAGCARAAGAADVPQGREVRSRRAVRRRAHDHQPDREELSRVLQEERRRRPDHPDLRESESESEPEEQGGEPGPGEAAARGRPGRREQSREVTGARGRAIVRAMMRRASLATPLVSLLVSLVSSLAACQVHRPTADGPVPSSWAYPLDATAVSAPHAMVVSDSALATHVGAQVLARGGNAVDAA